MGEDRCEGKTLARQYEAVFCIFMAVMAYLGRGNPDLVYPDVFYLFLVLLGLNFSAGVALRRWPDRRWVTASIILGNCGAITGLLYYSGGPSSNLWVLYLLPIYTVSFLLEGREAAMITAGAVCFNAVFYALWIDGWDAASLFEIALKNGILVFAAALTWRLVKAERLSLAKLRRQRTELSRLAERQEKSEKLAEVGLSSAGIVHDLKTPLTVIGGYADLGINSPSCDQEIRRDLEHIQRAARTCINIVEGLLNAARSETPSRRSCEIDDIAESAAGLCENLLAKAAVEVRRQFRAEPIFVTASPDQLQRVLVNLISNAAKAMPAGGLLTLKSETDGSATARLIVEDTGEGISDDAMSKLFKPFGTTRPQAGGTGLGLYVSRQIVMDHGGELCAERRPEGGTRFIVSLPLEASDQEPLRRR